MNDWPEWTNYHGNNNYLIIGHLFRNWIGRMEYCGSRKKQILWLLSFRRYTEVEKRKRRRSDWKATPYGFLPLGNRIWMTCRTWHSSACRASPPGQRIKSHISTQSPWNVILGHLSIIASWSFLLEPPSIPCERAEKEYKKTKLRPAMLTYYNHSENCGLHACGTRIFRFTTAGSPRFRVDEDA